MTPMSWWTYEILILGGQYDGIDPAIRDDMTNANESAWILFSKKSNGYSEKGVWVPAESVLECARILQIGGAKRICIAWCPELADRWYWK